MRHFLVWVKLPASSGSQETDIINRTPRSQPQFCTTWSALLLVILTGPLWASPGEQIDAEALIDRMEELYRGAASRAELTMQIETPHYSRTMNMTSVSRGDTHSFIRILTPRKDRGIATLRIDGDMWNYFPKINKVIKVPPSMMTSGWMGSDFNNDDLVKQTKLTDEYNLTVTESDKDYTIVLAPKSETVTVWGQIDYVVSKDPLLPLRQSFYDERGRMIRRMTFSDVQDFDGRQLPSKMVMETLNKPGHHTVITYDSLSFDSTIYDDVFTLRQLKRRF